MRFLLVAVSLFLSSSLIAQTLTVEKIMQDPKWIGTSPSNIFWGADSKTIYFSWNPDKKTSDSVYGYVIGGKQPLQVDYVNGLKIGAASGGVYDPSRTLMAYTYRGDVFMSNLKTGVTTRVTQTEDQ